MAEKTCIICGSTFYAPPSSKKITCSRECSRERKRQSHLGVSNRWSKEAKQRLKSRNMEDLQKIGTASAQKSPLAGSFETNINALEWTVVSPGGKVYQCRNLKKWIRDNADILPGTPEQAAAGLYAVKQWLIGRRKHPAPAWKGWTIMLDE